jgi:hypothetical protein
MNWFPSEQRSRVSLRDEVALNTHRLIALAERVNAADEKANKALLGQRESMLLSQEIKQQIAEQKKEMELHTRQSAELIATFRFASQLRKLVIGIFGAVVLYAGAVGGLKTIGIKMPWE